MPLPETLSPSSSVFCFRNGIWVLIPDHEGVAPISLAKFSPLIWCSWWAKVFVPFDQVSSRPPITSESAVARDCQLIE